MNKKSLFPIIKHSDRITLNELWHGDEIPYALKSSLAFIYCYHLQTVNVFRRNGNEIAHGSLLNCLKNNINSQPLLSLSMIYDVCSAIKAYVRDIPNGLMVKKLKNEWLKIARLTDKEQMLLKLKSIIQKLPQANRNLLFHFLVLSGGIIENQKENSMSSKSLSIVFLPCFFEKVFDMKNVKVLSLFVDLLDVMINHAKNLIESYQYTDIQKCLIEIGKSLVIQYPHDDDKSLDDNKRNQFASQDSGLNSTSYLDDKVSQSLSNSSQAQANYHQTHGNSIEDLLNDSDLSNATSCDLLDDDLLNRSDSITSTSSKFSTSDTSEHIHKHYAKCTQSHLNGNNKSCIGTHVHSLKECHPACDGSQQQQHHSYNNHKWDIISTTNKQTYKSVYGDLGFDTDFCFKRTCSQENQIILKPSADNLKRRKPLLKRSTVVISPLHLKDTGTLHSSSSTMTIVPANILSDQLSPGSQSLIGSIPSSSRSSINSDLSNQNISAAVVGGALKHRPKRIPLISRTRFTVPIRSIDPTDRENWIAHQSDREEICSHQLDAFYPHFEK